MRLITHLTTTCLACATFSGYVAAQSQKLDELFPSDRVILVEITVAEDDWDEIRFQTRNLLEVLQPKRQFEPIDSPFTYVDARVTIDGVTYPRVGLRKKGFIGSLDSERPSLKINLDEFDEGLDIDGLDNLTFNNNKQDTSLMSQFMTYRLFDIAGLPGPRCAYANVIVNGENLGVYAHVESMKAPLLEREFGSSKGTLFEGTVVDFYPDWEASFERKSGNDEQGRRRILEVIEAFELEDDDAFQEAIWELLDEESFYRYWALEGLLSFWDGYSGNRNNFYIYLDDATGKLRFMPWGADCVFQKYSPLGIDPDSPRSVRLVGRLAYRLYQIPSARRKYARTMKELMELIWDEEALLEETRRIESMITPALSTSQEYSVDFDAIREFIRKRRIDVEKEILGPDMPIWTEVPEEPPVIDENTFAEDFGKDSIWMAALHGDVAQVEDLLEEGVDIDSLQDGKTPPLGFAAIGNQVEMMRFLLERGANPDIVGSDFNSTLHTAAFLGRVDAVKVLIEAGANLDKINAEGATPLDSAATPWMDEFQFILDFLSALMDIEFDTEEVKRGRLEVTGILRASGAESAQDMDLDEAGDLWWSAKNGKITRLDELIESGVDVDALDPMGISAISWAVLTDHGAFVEQLLDHGADVNVRNRDGATALHAAAFLGKTRMATLLIEHGIDPGIRNLAGESPLAAASAPWNSELEGVVTWISGMLKIEVDIKAVEAGRPKTAAIIEEAMEY